MGLDSVELVIAFEERFGVKISDEVAEQLTTPRKVVDYLMTTPVGTVMPRTEVYAIVREVVEYQTATTDFHEDSRFVEDLHID